MKKSSIPSLKEILAVSVLGFVAGAYVAKSAPNKISEKPVVARQSPTNLEKKVEISPKKVEKTETKDYTQLILQRDTYTSKSITGELYLDNNKNGVVDSGDKRLCYTLELPHRGNRTDVSSIPIGTYDLNKRTSSKFNKHYILDSVPGRSYILIHPGNQPKQTKGCILVGRSRKKDFVGNSKAALKGLLNDFKDTKNLRLKVMKK